MYCLKIGCFRMDSGVWRRERLLGTEGMAIQKEYYSGLFL